MIVVDELRRYPHKGTYQWRCFLMTDDKTEKGLISLHNFAATIGIDRLYFEDSSHFPRYVLVEKWRDRALAGGALSVSSGAMLAMCSWPTRRRVVQVNLKQEDMFDDVQ